MYHLYQASSYTVCCFVYTFKLCTNNSIGVVPKEYFVPFTGLVLGVLLLIAATLFLCIEKAFHGLITYEYSDDLGYFGHFHRGIELILKGLSVCCEGSLACFGGGSGGEDHPLMSAPATQASPPPPYFVSALLSSIYFADH